jgi:ABC-type transport system substrate-binding protein
MKLVKNLVFAMVLASILAISAPAGELNTPGAAPTPTPTPQEVIAVSDDGTVSDPITGDTETSDYLFYGALAALLSMY